tara:strand:+ start:5815 stop:6771 length:957 start_codon:yes stop_codon:yes gene_type:complete
MKIKKPIFWDKKKPNFLTYILFPLTFLIKINNIIIKFFPKKKFNQIKTICVGNIYLGGTGKTPTSLKLYQILKTKKYNTVIGKKYYPNQKDEIILLKNKSNFISSENREKIIKIAIDKNYELIIFDDGLQERRIHYDLRFVCFDSKIWLGNRYLIPSGPLRENIYSLKKYDGVFLKITDESSNLTNVISEIRKINSKIGIFKSRVEIKNIYKFDLSDKYFIFSGIGNSKSFKEILINNKFNIIEEKIFSDHYEYKDVDIQKILEISKRKNLKILTTEKDYVKIPDNLKDKIDFIEIDLKIDEEEKLVEFIEAKINEKN